MRFDAEDEAFIAKAQAWLRSLDDNVRKDLRTVLRQSPGYYPTTLARAWPGDLGPLPLTLAVQAAQPPSRVQLPVPHPADYEWRFTEDAAERLLRESMHGLSAGDSILHVGTPTTFLRGHERFSQFRHILFEGSSAITEALAGTEGVNCINMVHDVPPSLQVGAAIIDPPWYAAETKAFLAATSHACRVGARIVLCQPTLATRPGIAEERTMLLAALPTLGIDFTEVLPVAIRYVMPHFEACSLRAVAPELLVPADWRAGDVVIGHKVKSIPPAPLPASESEQWSEHRFGPARFKLRNSGGSDLGVLVNGDRLATVSRRDPMRRNIGLWTSGNRVFSLTHALAIGRLIDSCHSDLMQAQFTHSNAMRRAAAIGVDKSIASRLVDLLLSEYQEHILYLERVIT